MLARFLFRRAASPLPLVALLAVRLVCPISDGGIDVRVDPRVELLAIVFRLAGNPEYGMGRVPAYEAAIEKAFGAYRDHAAVQEARRLREKHGISFDAVASCAIHLTDPPELAERVPFDGTDTSLERRWHGSHARPFVALLRRFAEDTDFAAFFASQRPLYARAEAQLRGLVEQRVSVAWFDRFFGARPAATFVAVPGMGNGGANYGPRVRRPDGREELFAIIGVGADAGGAPQLDPGVVGTIVHEFAHSYVNPLVEAHRSELTDAGEKIFAAVADEMRAQAYANGETMLKETLVRAAVARYVRAHDGEAAAARELADQRGRGFLWIDDVDALLGRYEEQRGEDARFEVFLPEVCALFEQIAETIDARVEAFDRSRPNIASITPPDGATDVDPQTDAIVLAFDRPMGRGYSINYGPGGKATYPDVQGQSWDSSQKAFTLRVRLAPSTAYELRLTGRGFRSADGVPLRGKLVRFRTGAERGPR